MDDSSSGVEANGDQRSSTNPPRASTEDNGPVLRALTVVLQSARTSGCSLSFGVRDCIRASEYNPQLCVVAANADQDVKDHFYDLCSARRISFLQGPSSVELGSLAGSNGEVKVVMVTHLGQKTEEHDFLLEHLSQNAVFNLPQQNQQPPQSSEFQFPSLSDMMVYLITAGLVMGAIGAITYQVFYYFKRPKDRLRVLAIICSVLPVCLMVYFMCYKLRKRVVDQGQ